MNIYQVLGVILLALIPSFLVGFIRVHRQMKRGLPESDAFEEGWDIMRATWVSFTIVFLGHWLIRQ